MPPEACAQIEIDNRLQAASWVVQDLKQIKKRWQLFGQELDTLMDETNEELVA